VLEESLKVAPRVVLLLKQGTNFLNGLAAYGYGSGKEGVGAPFDSDFLCFLVRELIFFRKKVRLGLAEKMLLTPLLFKEGIDAAVRSLRV
jgi:hypothetical protein